MSNKILVVDDDKNIAELLSIYLNKEGFETVCAYNGAEALKLFDEIEPQVVILDIMLPVMDGWQVCREIRNKSSVPVIMITAKSETFDKVLGFDLGADDYVVKPFDAIEVVARVKAVIRRSRPNDTELKEVKYDKLVISLSNYSLVVNGKQINTPPKELELIYYLASNPNKVFTRNQLLDKVWGFDCFGDSRTVDVHIKRLREKLDGVSTQWDLRTVWGVGYKFETIQ